MSAIETFNLTKKYGALIPGRGRTALEDLTMSVPRGRIFGFLGPNGAGKTTTLRLLLGLTQPTSGSARMLGEDIGNPEVRSRVGYMAEKQKFYDYLRAGEFLNYSAKFYRMDGATRKKRISQLLDYVGLGKEKSARIRTFSLGMLRRLALAQAMLNDPELLLLDEPLAGLDPLGRRHFKDLIQQTCREEGKSVLVCSHVLLEMEKLCDTVAILSNGHLIVQDDLSNLQKLRKVTLTLSGADAETLQKLQRVGFTVEKRNGQTVLSAAGEEKAQQAQELLEDCPAECVNSEVTPESLEDFFLRVVREPKERE